MAAEPEDERPHYIFAWPKGKPLPKNYVDGNRAFLEGDEDVVYPPAGRGPNWEWVQKMKAEAAKSPK
ncbi:MAG TPA: hypothetical protein VMU93_15280 [Caulobacteraceae bacterium]|nr:hypothetical protein [Caulobacteraceae bacterium]